MRPIDISSTPGSRLRTARKAAGLTQAQLAARVGLAQSAVSDAETANPPTMLAATLAALCSSLGVTLDYVMRGDHADTIEVEAEAVRLLRAADPAARETAMKGFRAMLAQPTAEPGKQQVR